MLIKILLQIHDCNQSHAWFAKKSFLMPVLTTIRKENFITITWLEPNWNAIWNQVNTAKAEAEMAYQLQASKVNPFLPKSICQILFSRVFVKTFFSIVFLSTSFLANIFFFNSICQTHFSKVNISHPRWIFSSPKNIFFKSICEQLFILQIFNFWNVNIQGEREDQGGGNAGKFQSFWQSSQKSIEISNKVKVV